jgi:hypothetical protein
VGELKVKEVLEYFVGVLFFIVLILILEHKIERE